MWFNDCWWDGPLSTPKLGWWDGSFLHLTTTSELRFVAWHQELVIWGINYILFVVLWTYCMWYYYMLISNLVKAKTIIWGVNISCWTSPKPSWTSPWRHVLLRTRRVRHRRPQARPDPRLCPLCLPPSRRLSGGPPIQIRRLSGSPRPRPLRPLRGCSAPLPHQPSWWWLNGSSTSGVLENGERPRGVHLVPGMRLAEVKTALMLLLVHQDLLLFLPSFAGRPFKSFLCFRHVWLLRAGQVVHRWHLIRSFLTSQPLVDDDSAVELSRIRDWSTPSNKSTTGRFRYL